jgi:hypothetical protein
MKKYLVLLALLAASSIANASWTEFCEGFAEGYKSVKGSYAMVPTCPLNGGASLSNTAYREGIRAGVKAAMDSR